MTKPTAFTTRGKASSISLMLGLLVALTFFLASGIISYSNTRTMDENARLVTETHVTLAALSDIASLMKDAETGQRGYILTGNSAYLSPYTDAKANIPKRLEELDILNKRGGGQIENITQLKENIHLKFDEMQRVIDAKDEIGQAAAVKIILGGHGKAAMDDIRHTVSAMQDKEREIRFERLEEMRRAYHTTLTSGIITSLSGAILAIIVVSLMSRALKIRKEQEWLQAGQAGISAAMLGDLRIEQLGDNVLRFFADYFGAHAGAFFVKEGGEYKRVATYGVPATSDTPQKFTHGDGLLGQAAKDKKPFIVRDVPEGYLSVGSAFGQNKPRTLLIAPAVIDDIANTVFELGFLHDLDDISLRLLGEVADSIGVAVRAADYRAHLQNLLEETQRQAEELQAQSEELRVNNEELEEQSRALKESQARLEQQQVEMEQTNSQLEEQTQQLENQKDEMVRANAEIMAKARELEQASQYKSDFLANMSHELRTPLNSSLILAKLLADNPDGNLTDEQVKFAQTIQSSGNDLLNLINDILDLSKIEAGHMEIRSENVRITRMADDLSPIFKPLAKEKNLEFNIRVETGTPEIIETDRQRLEQILKNLLSNAFKFTEKGRVELVVSASENNVRFSVSDTGIGITKEQQKAIFDAFRQADSTISRKYGGTGLGLSISRELARLLGGSIELKSNPGEGSVFSIILPRAYDESAIKPRDVSEPVPATINDTHQKPLVTKRITGSSFEDDRDKLQSDSRVILVIEDDDKFARILYDLAHEQDFLCIVSSTAEEGLSIAKQYLPSAVLLDVGLPDNSGLSVLDRLKRNPHTRHIPVHVVSAGDYMQTALSLGAIGYIIKPVKREQILDILQQLETKISQKLHRVLLVEDDKTQRESMGMLLGSKDVDIVGAGTAAECLDLLKSTTFDCMVLDLTLPDASGFSLLETLSREDSYSFPPVIVYTGRELSADEEQKLRRYSKSIIIKGAKSPERLLDEVTLFLHQVVADLDPELQKMLQIARNRDDVLEGRRILVVEDDVRNVYSLTNILEPRGAIVEIARNGQEAIAALKNANDNPDESIDLVLMDVMMPVMDGLTAAREIRKNADWKKLPIIMLTAKAMKDDQERCLDAGANDYMAKPLDVEKLLSLVRVWMPR